VKRWPSLTAAITGLIIGFLCATYVGMAVGLATSPTARAMAIVIIVCPAIYAIWWNFWLVPALNALLYGGIAFGIFKVAIQAQILTSEIELIHYEFGIFLANDFKGFTSSNNVEPHSTCRYNQDGTRPPHIERFMRVHRAQEGTFPLPPAYIRWTYSAVVSWKVYS
jgi:hypothetical protein